MTEVELYLFELYREKRRLAQISIFDLRFAQQSYVVTTTAEAAADEISDRGGDN